jgi:hypothetical protein
VYSKLIEVSEQDPGNASSQIGQQKITIQTLYAKFRNIYLRNLAEIRLIIGTKFREINFNFVLISYFVK